MNPQNWTAKSAIPGITACVWAYGGIAAAAFFSEIFIHPVNYVLVVWFIAARQHTLYVLNHDASHGNIFATPVGNRLFATLFCNLPFFHHPEAFSYVLWRRVHILHHARLFTRDDPNHVGRKERGDTVGPLTVSAILSSMMKAPFEAGVNFFFGRQDYVPGGVVKEWNGARVGHQKLFWLPIRGDGEMEAERRWKLAFIFAVAVFATYFSFWKILLLYWFVPLYTFYPAILRLMDLTEHNWSDTSGELSAQANSRSLSWVARLFVSDLNRHLHWEHHVSPIVPFYRLPAYARFLRESEPSAPRQRGGLL